MNRRKIVVVREGELPPYCRGCWNAKGDCGTPCQFCEKAKQWDVYILRIFIKKDKVNGNE
jgi:hypothetical protein